jgi:hypothetical protein
MYGANPSAMPHPPDVEAGGGLLDGLADWFVGWAGTLAGYGSRAIVRKGKGWVCSEKATESCLVQVGCDVLSSPLTHSLPNTAPFTLKQSFDIPTFRGSFSTSQTGGLSDSEGAENSHD